MLNRSDLVSVDFHKQVGRSGITLYIMSVSWTKPVVEAYRVQVFSQTALGLYFIVCVTCLQTT